MADQIRYGAGGLPYVGPGGTPAPAPEPVVEETPEEPEVTVTVIEDDTPLTDEEVVTKAKGNGK
ncbi:MAG: hypothetical protein QGH83_12300 [Candidatus Pacebacteria bacterium]|nr:hypothetical protein [Candidatus Paceibacterota bacterium]